MGSQPSHWNVFSFYLVYSYISCVEREPGITQDYLLLYMYVVGCYAKFTLCKGCAWNNSYSGQEEATLCIVYCLKEDRKLVFQMINKLYII